MLTVSANFQTALKRSGALEFRYIIKLGNSLIASPYTAGNFYFSTQFFDITDSGTKPVDGILKSIPAITENLDMYEHKASIGGFSIELINMPAKANVLFSDQFLTYNIFNKDVYVYLWCTGLTVLSDCVQLYKGLSREPKYDIERITIPVENSTSTVNKDIPAIINSTDYPNAPTESLGKVKPIIYGNHIFNMGNTDPDIATLSQVNNMTKMVDLGIIFNDGSRGWLITGHQLDEIDSIWGFDKNLGCRVKLKTFTTVQNSATGAIIKHAENENFYNYRKGIGFENEDNAGNGDWSTHAKMADGEFDYYSDSNATTGDEGDHSKIEVMFPGWEDSGVDDDDIAEIGLWGRTYYTVTGAPAETYFRIYLAGSFATNCKANGESNTIYEIGVDAVATKAKINANITVDHLVVNMTGGSLEYCRVFEIYKRVEYLPSSTLQLYASCKGREATATVAGHFSGLSTGDLLEIPAHIIDSIIYDELGQVIDITSAQLVATELASWEMSLSVEDKQINSRKLLEKIAKQSMSFILWNSNNECSLDTFFALNTTNLILGKNDIKQGTLEVYKSSLKNLVNELNLKYKKNITNDELIKLLKREDDRANVGSQAIYNAEMVKTIEADFIADSATAILFANHWCKDNADSFWSVLRNIVEFDLTDLKGMTFWTAGAFKPIFSLELTDIIELYHTDWDSILKCFGVSWSGKQFKIFSINRKSLHIKAMELD